MDCSTGEYGASKLENWPFKNEPGSRVPGIFCRRCLARCRVGKEYSFEIFAAPEENVQRIAWFLLPGCAAPLCQTSKTRVRAAGNSDRTPRSHRVLGIESIEQNSHQDSWCES